MYNNTPPPGKPKGKETVLKDEKNRLLWKGNNQM